MKVADVPVMVRTLARYRSDGQWTFQKLTAKMWAAQQPSVDQAKEIVIAIAGTLDAMNKETDEARRASGEWTAADAYQRRRDWLDQYYRGVGDDSIDVRKTRTGDAT